MNELLEKMSPAAMSGEMMDSWLASVKAMNASLDSMEVFSSSWFDDYHTFRQEGEKMLEAFIEQNKSNLVELEESWKAALQNVPGWDNFTLENLRKQFEEFSSRFSPDHDR